MTAFNRRSFLALGATGMLAPALAAISDPTQPIERRKRINPKASLEDNLINEFLQPKPLALKVGAAEPFAALHFSDTHVSMMDAADILSGKVKELSLYEARNHGLFGRGGFPFAVQSLAATLAYAKRKNVPMLNTGDLFDFRSEANIACIANSFKGADVFSSLGNHEGHGLHSPGMNPQTAAAEDALRARYEKAIGNPLVVASRVINGVNFVAFDNALHNLREETIDGVKREFWKGLPVVLMCHVPPTYTKLFRENSRRAMCTIRAGMGGKPAAPESYPLPKNPADRHDERTKGFYGWLRERKDLKAILCGHTHYAEIDDFSETAKMYVAGGNYEGHAYEITFK